MAAVAIKEVAASLLSKLLSKFRTSEGAVNFVVQKVNILTDLYLNFIKEWLSEKCALSDGHLTIEEISLQLDALRGQSLFEGVQSKPYLESYIAHQSTDNNPFGLKQIIFDHKVVFRKGIPYNVTKDYAYFVPFLPQLEQLLSCKDVLECVDNPRESVDGVFKSVTDGYLYRGHYLVEKYGNKVLSIIIYVDDVEFADPCKSKTKKHKLRLFYWMLGNIYPEKRSSLKAINLLAIVRYEVAKKWGNEEILKYFVTDMIKLGDGVQLRINGVVRLFYAFLQFVVADIPAAANLGGFKESHFALRPCRICMCTRYELCDHFKEVEHFLRRTVDHDKYLDEIEGCPQTPAVTVVNVDLNNDMNDLDFEEEQVEDDLLQDSSAPVFNDHVNPSINYGINSRSVLAQAPGFQVTKGLPFDVMHVIFEGCAESLCRFVLRDMCLKPKQPPQEPGQQKKRKRSVSRHELKRISLAEVNRIIQEASDFGHLNVSKPSPIEKSHLKSKLKQSASQIIVLLHVLPIIASNHIEDQKLELFGQLIKLISLVMKFEHNENNLEDLDETAERFAENFVKCYPEAKTLKLHALRHLKMQIILHGPLRQQASFRFEAFHRVFTRLVDIVNNMKNIEFSLICRHLTERNCDILNGKDDGTYLYPGDTVRKSESNKLNTLPEKDNLLLSFEELDEDVEIATVDTFERHGRSWHNGVVFSLQDSETDSDGVSRFGIIVKIYLINDDLVFLFNELKVNFIEKFYAYEVTGRNNKDLKCIKFSEIKFQVPILKFTVQLGTNRTKSFLVFGSSGDIVS